MLIQVSFLDPFIFGTSILKPNLDLSFGQSQIIGQFTSAPSADVLRTLILNFEPQSLLRTERGPLTSRSALFSSPPGHCNMIFSI